MVFCMFPRVITQLPWFSQAEPLMVPLNRGVASTADRLGAGDGAGFTGYTGNKL
jgi:hypothetical protein